MINLEALQVFSIDDGAGGLVLATWVQSSTVEGVPKVQRTILISNEEARLLAKELNAAVTPDEVKGDDRKIERDCLCPCHLSTPFTSDGNKQSDILRRFCCGCDDESSELGGVTSSAHVAELHMHGLTYYRGAHCSGHQSKHQQVAVSNV